MLAPSQNRSKLPWHIHKIKVALRDPQDDSCLERSTRTEFPCQPPSQDWSELPCQIHMIRVALRDLHWQQNCLVKSTTSELPCEIRNIRVALLYTSPRVSSVVRAPAPRHNIIFSFAQTIFLTIFLSTYHPDIHSHLLAIERLSVALLAPRLVD